MLNRSLPDTDGESSVKEKAESAKERAKAKAKRATPKTAETDEKELAKGEAIRRK